MNSLVTLTTTLLVLHLNKTVAVLVADTLLQYVHRKIFSDAGAQAPFVKRPKPLNLLLELAVLRANMTGQFVMLLALEKLFVLETEPCQRVENASPLADSVFVLESLLLSELQLETWTYQNVVNSFA